MRLILVFSIEMTMILMEITGGNTGGNCSSSRLEQLGAGAAADGGEGAWEEEGGRVGAPVGGAGRGGEGARRGGGWWWGGGGAEGGGGCGADGRLSLVHLLKGAEGGEAGHPIARKGCVSGWGRGVTVDRGAERVAGGGAWEEGGGRVVRHREGGGGGFVCFFGAHCCCRAVLPVPLVLAVPVPLVPGTKNGDMRVVRFGKAAVVHLRR